MTGSSTCSITGREEKPVRRLHILAFGLVSSFGCAIFGTRAAATTHVLTYNVEHPTYGIIGTYTNAISQHGDSVDVRTDLHIAVRAIGIPLYHQDATREERWQHHRLVDFQSSTDDNGTEILVSGRAEEGRFIIRSSSNGFLTAPAQVYPSNPWSPSLLRNGTMMSTKTGRVHPAVVTDTGEVNVTLGGRSMNVHQWFVDDEKHQVVWIDGRGVIVGFETQEKGQTIDFVLKSEATDDGAIANLPDQ
jgi:hypothetical protein